MNDWDNPSFSPAYYGIRGREDISVDVCRKLVAAGAEVVSTLQFAFTTPNASNSCSTVIPRPLITRDSPTNSYLTR